MWWWSKKWRGVSEPTEAVEVGFIGFLFGESQLEQMKVHNDTHWMSNDFLDVQVFGGAGI